MDEVDDGTTTPGTIGPGGSGGDAGSVVDPSKDGKYYVNVALWNAKPKPP